MKLYQEIILLREWFKGLFVIENTISYYEPLIKPQEIGSHYYWANFKITQIPKLLDQGRAMGTNETIEGLQKNREFDLNKINCSKIDKRLALRNCVEPKVALHIFNCAFKNKQQTL